MKLGTATSVLYRYAIQDAVKVVAEAGYDGIDIWGGRPHVYRQDLSPAELQQLRQSIADHGLSVVSLMPAFYRYPHSLSNPNPRVRDDSIDYMRQCTDNAAALGAPIVLVVPDFTLFGDATEDARQRMTESVGEVAHYASQYELKLGIEILWEDETDLVTTTDHALTMIRTVRSDNLGVVLDTGAMHLCAESADEMVTRLGNLLLQVHVSDNHGVKQQNLIPGEGTYDFPALIQVLQQHGYAGFLSAELSREYADDPAPALRTTAERMRAWMAA